MTDQVRRLRELTGAGILECKEALGKAKGQVEEAAKILRAKGADIAAAKAGRTARQGLIGSYVHGGKIGVLVEVNCETDFVARTDPFKSFVHELCLQVASMGPAYVSRDDVPPEEISDTLSHLHEEIAGVEDESSQSIQQSHMENFYKQRVLLDQAYVKDPSKTIQDLLHETVSTLRENIQIRRFARFVLGEDVQGR
ncbi:MAG: elongation factor Ts [Candidatus Omnitrophica bacterium]|nr:elongation factor Ts [Candidatus Omnitrophota bacterium]